MAKRPNQPENFVLPLSGVILGIVIRALQLSSRDETNTLGSKTATRYFGGERISDENRTEILAATAHAFIKAGFVPEPPQVSAAQQGFAALLGEFLGWLATQWDALAGHIRGIGVVISSRERAAAAPLPYLRLAVIEVSLRVAALLRLTDTTLPEGIRPAWTQKEGKAVPLRALMNRASPRPTRDKLAEAVGAHRRSIDAWLGGTARPSDENIQDLAEEFRARIDGADAAVLTSMLRRHYALYEVAERLAARVGWHEVEELGKRLWHYVAVVHRILSPAAPVLIDPVQILITGTQAPGSHYLIDQLMEEEASTMWRTNLIAACEPWLPHLESIARQLSDQHVREAAAAISVRPGKDLRSMGVTPEEMAEMMAPTLAQINMALPLRRADEETFKYVVTIPASNAQKAANRLDQAQQCLADNQYDAALVHARRAVQLHPDDANAHYTLGAALNYLGKWDESQQECWIAHRLRSDWQLPILEIAIVFNKTRRFVEAGEILERFERQVGPYTPMVLFEWGVAHLNLRQYDKAAEKFERVFLDAPEHARALDYAARCYFMMGDSTRGQKLAKQAQQLGQTATYEQWRAGAFRGPFGRAQ